MEVLNLKEGMKIKQQMVHRNRESQGYECRESQGSTAHQRGYRGGTVPGWGWSGDKREWSNALGMKARHLFPKCATLSPSVSELSALHHQLQQD